MYKESLPIDWIIDLVSENGLFLKSRNGIILHGEKISSNE
jgi:hypothetical protein